MNVFYAGVKVGVYAGAKAGVLQVLVFPIVYCCVSFIFKAIMLLMHLSKREKLYVVLLCRCFIQVLRQVYLQVLVYPIVYCCESFLFGATMLLIHPSY